MNATRRNFILGGVAASAAVALPGCRTVPEADVVRLVARGIGGSTGLVINECDISDEARNRIVEVAGNALRIIPQPGQTLEEAWLPYARDYIDSLVASGRIDRPLGNVVLEAFKLIMKGYALVEARHPKVRTVRELSEAALAGFCEGLTDTMKPVNADPVEIDVGAFRELKATNAFFLIKSAARASATFSRRKPR